MEKKNIYVCVCVGVTGVADTSIPSITRIL